MEIIINIDDYLSEEEKKQIVQDEYTDIVRHHILSDKERIFSNAAYRCVFEMVDASINEDLQSIIINKVKNILENPSSYCVFRQKDVWGKEDSLGWKYVQEAVEKNKETIHNMVSMRIKEYNSEYLQEAIEQLVLKVIEERIIGARE